MAKGLKPPKGNPGNPGKKGGVGKRTNKTGTNPTTVKRKGY